MKDSSESRAAKICALCGASYAWDGDEKPGLCRGCLQDPSNQERMSAAIVREWEALARCVGPHAAKQIDDARAAGKAIVAIDVDGASVLLEGVELLAAIAARAEAPRPDIASALGVLRSLFRSAGPLSTMALSGCETLAERRATIYCRSLYYRERYEVAAAEISRLRDCVRRLEKSLAKETSVRETLAGSIDDTFRTLTAVVAEGPPQR